MPRIEQADYPYVEGSHGISFDQLEAGNVGRELIMGGSGRNLYFESRREKGDFELVVEDASLPDCYLIARTVSPNTILFNLNTDTSPEGGNRHPDMYAARFVDFAFYNFERLGKEINRWRSGWEPSSVNYRKFRELIDQGCDVQTAAEGTWTGKLATKYGFEFDNSSPWFIDAPHRVMVEFRR